MQDERRKKRRFKDLIELIKKESYGKISEEGRRSTREIKEVKDDR